MSDAAAQGAASPGAGALQGAVPKLEIHDLSISYVDRAGKVVRAVEGVNLSVANKPGVGELAVLLGPSGCGKSTILKAICGLLQPDSGTILIDGVDVKTMRLGDLRKTVVLIDQSPYLFHGTVFENIAYAKPSVDRGAVEEAAHAAGLTELLERLPAGINTIVGERGLTLSAGERQRIAIARAFLWDPQVLILDEPSAALDAERERELIDNLRWKFFGRTLIAITHKPALSGVADHIFYVKDGRVVEPVASMARSEHLRG